jgi:hypothetical protein
MRSLYLTIFIFGVLSCTAQKKVAVNGVTQTPPQGVPDAPPASRPPPLKGGVPGFIRFDQQEDAMLQAVQALPEFERLQTRFIVCSDQYNADGVDAVKECKDGVTKALNSVSDERTLSDVTPIGPAGSIMQIRLDDFGLTPAKWRLIEANDPFKFTSETVRGQTLQFLTQSLRPMINGHNFAETALVKAYYGLTEVPGTFAAFQQKIGANVQQDFDNRDPDVAVYGMNESVIATNRQFRLIHRSPSEDGVLWCTNDTNDVVVAPVVVNGQLINKKNLLEAPFPVFARSAKNFTQDAGECMYTLPNGMIGFALFNAAGVREDFAPTNIVQDTASASRGLSGTIQNARSCFRCHATGFIPLVDSIGPHIASNTSFNAADKQLGRIFFKSKAVGSAFIEQDNDDYAEALEKLDVSNPTEDSINELTDKLRSEQDARQVAGLLGITEEELKTGLAASTGASAIIGALLQPNGKVNLQALIDGLPVLIEDMNLFQDDI